jgi:dihydroxyacetone kinase
MMGSLAGGQGAGQQQILDTPDLLGSALDGTAGGQSTSSQGGLDLGDLLNTGMACMNSQQQDDNSLEAIIKAFVAATQADQKANRAQSGELVANTILTLNLPSPAASPAAQARQAAGKAGTFNLQPIEEES